MATTRKRERQLARERYERQQARRAAERARKRQLQQVTAVVTAVLVVVGGLVFLTTVRGDDTATTNPAAKTKTNASASPTPPVSPSPATSEGHTHTCAYTKSGEPPAKDVGLPKYDEKTAHEPFTATLKTNRGDIAVAVDAAKAPCTATSFKHLASKGYFAKTSCHRLTTEGLFVLQCGDPTGTGGGGPGYGFGIENAPADGKFPAGSLAMARSNDPNSNGSQFFLVYKDSQLPTEGGGYSIFGRVTKGLDVVNKVAAGGVAGGGGEGPPAQKVTIEAVDVGGS